ncbi:MAG TPA: glycosyltransferase [Pirellulales bacterium]
MNLSLSVLLPVQNVQSTLHSQIQQLLDVLPELTPKFEVVVIDDGSTDATSEVAVDLKRGYPQLKVVHHAASIGWAAAIARQASQAQGEYLMIHCGGDIVPDELVGLWRMRQGISSTVLAKAKAAESGRQLRIDPKSAELGDPPPNASQAEVLGGWAIHARGPRSNLLLVHRQQLPRLERSLKSLMPNRRAATQRSPAATPSKQAMKSPTFLGRLKSLALDE